MNNLYRYDNKHKFMKYCLLMMVLFMSCSIAVNIYQYDVIKGYSKELYQYCNGGGTL